MNRLVIASLALIACTQGTQQTPAPFAAAPPDESVLRGRALVLNHACSGCHGGSPDPASDGYLAGTHGPEGEFAITIPENGKFKLPGTFKTRPRNLTPDNQTGLGRFSERQIFNALRFGLRPGETPDVEITSSTPGQGNFPANPKYLAPPMPWPAWRNMRDQELRDMAAYLKRGLKAVANKVADSEGPADFWAEAYGAADSPLPALPFPTANENPNGANDAQVLHGRALLIHHDCGGCHGGGTDPSRPVWLQGARTPDDTFMVGAIAVRARNLTPDTLVGTGRYSERQIFNALRFGLRPGETPDVTITSTTPGQGNYPKNPKYLAPIMPWAWFRHMTDQELRDIVAYLKRGLKPVANKVAESDRPDDWWVSASTVEEIGPYPARPFPTVNERMP